MPHYGAALAAQYMTLKVLYNGSCPICSREIRLYKRLAARHGVDIAFEDIASTDLADWGLSADVARRRLHAREAGQMLHGLAAFRALWARLPGWRWLARAADMPVLGSLFALIYDWVAAPLLYRFTLWREGRRTAA